MRVEVLKKCYAQLNESRPVRELTFYPEQWKSVRSFGMITAKKTLFVANVGEEDIAGASDMVKKIRERAAAEGAPAIAICGKLEAEIAELGEQDRTEMLSGMGLKEPALAVLAPRHISCWGCTASSRPGRWRSRLGRSPSAPPRPGGRRHPQRL